MSKLSLGDEILGFDHGSGRSVFSPLRAWLHRVPEEEMLMTKIEADDVSFVASSKHLMAVKGGAEYEFAGYLKPHQDVLMMGNGSGTTVRKVTDAIGRGLYAPLTGTSNFYVEGDGGHHRVLAHSFAHVRNPRKYETIFHKLLDVGEFIWPSLSHVDDTSLEAYIHPLADLWMKFLGVSIVQEPLIRRRLRSNSLFEFEDITLPDTDTMKQNDMADHESATGRRLYNSGGGGNNNQQQLILILLAVVENMPPFLRHASTIPGSLPPPVAPRTVDVDKMLADAMTKNTIVATVVGIFIGGIWCCMCFLSLLSKLSNQSRVLSRSRDDSELSQLTEE
jgi:hypothetical protein